MRWSYRHSFHLAGVLGLLGAVLGFVGHPGVTEQSLAADAGKTAAKQPAARLPLVRFSELDPTKFQVVDGAAVAELPDRRSALLTLDVPLQEAVSAMFERYKVLGAALVAMRPQDGRLLAYVSYSGATGRRDLARDVVAPAASVFKIITAAALVDQGVSADKRVCFHGGARRLSAKNLADVPARDTECATLSEAMGGSINAVFAKLADRHLDQDTLGRYASAFGFGQAIPFDAAAVPSRAQIPGDRLEFARTAAGFWHTYLSPLHASLIAATVANGGRMPVPTLVERVFDASGQVTYRFEVRTFREVIPRATAESLNQMMQGTVSQGTSRRAFHDPAGRPFLRDIKVAAKTGTLSASDPYRGFTWWVGFAPADQPTIALAALVINEPKWRIKAADVAREALKAYLLRK